MNLIQLIIETHEIKKKGLEGYLNYYRQHKNQNQNFSKFEKKSLKIEKIYDQKIYSKIFNFKCYKRSLVMYKYCCLNGINCKFIMGMRSLSNNRRFGHAWIEVNGQPYLEKIDLKIFHVIFEYKN